MTKTDYKGELLKRYKIVLQFETVCTERQAKLWYNKKYRAGCLDDFYDDLDTVEVKCEEIPMKGDEDESNTM